MILRLCQRRLREEGLAAGEGREVGGGHAGDLGEGFLREKGLVCGDENVGESEQAREFVVMQDLAGEILEEDAFLFLIHVERDAAEAAGFERLDQRLGVNERAAADVEQDSAWLHQFERFATDDVVCVRRKRRVKRDDFTLARERVGVGVFDAVLLRPLDRRERIERQHAHPEPAQDLRGDAADFARAENAGGLAVKVETDEAVEREVQIMHAVVGARDFAIECWMLRNDSGHFAPRRRSGVCGCNCARDYSFGRASLCCAVASAPLGFCSDSLRCRGWFILPIENPHNL